MLVFRFFCAVVVAWATNWVLGQPVAATLMEEIPEMSVIGPVSGALVGYFVLAKRQGNGIVIGTLNGAWIGLLVIAFAGFLFLTTQMFGAVRHGLIKDFENFLRVLGTEAKPLIEVSTDLKLVGLTVAVTAVAGLVSEILRKCLRWARKARGEEEPQEEVRAGVAKAGGPLS